MATRLFSTDRLTGTASAQAWRRFLGEIYYDLDVAPVESTVHASLHETALHEMRLSRIRANAMNVMRHKASASADDEEYHVLLLPLSGSLVFRQRGREGEIAAGGAILMHSTEPYELPSPGYTDHLTLVLPCDRLRDRLPWVDDLCATAALSRHPMIPLIGDMIRNVMDLDPASTAAPRFEAPLLDLVSIALDSTDVPASLDGRRSSTTPALVRTFHLYLRQCYSDPSLSVETAARSCRISTRSLHRMLHDRGTTFGSELRKVRLQAAEKMLCDRSLDAIQIGEIAYQCGFGSQASFSTVFRQKYGSAPRQFRKTSVCGDL